MSPDKSASNNSASSKETRAKAKAAAEAERAAQARRDTMVKVIGGVVVAGVVAAIIGVGVVTSNKKSDEAANALNPVPNAALPKTVDPVTLAVPHPANKGGDLPKLELWEDFQCPACKAVEDANGTGIEAQATSGKVNLFWRPTSFLDVRLPQSNFSSQRATAAWGCAIDQGKTVEFHNTIFANQPKTEGEGYSAEQLKGFGKQVGLSGAAYDTFASCVDDGTYKGWANNSYQKFQEGGIGGTPAGILNGTLLENVTLADNAKLTAAIAEAAAGKVPSGAASEQPVPASAQATPSASAS